MAQTQFPNHKPGARATGAEARRRAEEQLRALEAELARLRSKSSGQ